MFKKLITYTTALMIAVGGFVGASLAKDYSGKVFAPAMLCFSVQSINETAEAILLDREKAFATINSFPRISAAEKGSGGCYVNDLGEMITLEAGETIRVFQDKEWSVSIVKSVEAAKDGTYAYWFVAEKIEGQES